MDSGYYAAYSGLMARNQAVDVAASNLANTGTTGYRAGREYFRSAVSGEHAMESQLGHTMNNFGVLGGDRFNLMQGPLSSTGNPLDAAIEGEGFFAIQTKSGIAYTRDGAFLRAPTGQLTTANGEPVLNAQLKPIQVPPGAVTISGGGEMSVDEGTFATLGVFTFAVDTQLEAQGANRYKVAKDVKPVIAKGSSIHSGALEGSNQDIVQGSLDLVLMQRQAEMMQKALSIFHQDINRIASQDLAKVV